MQVACDIWLVNEDYTAQSDKEITVLKGQQVELLDTTPATAPAPDFCLIRLANPEAGTADWASAEREGLIPVSLLKQVPNLKVSGSRGSITIDGDGRLFFLLHILDGILLGPLESRDHKYNTFAAAGTCKCCRCRINAYTTRQTNYYSTKLVFGKRWISFIFTYFDIPITSEQQILKFSVVAMEMVINGQK